MSEKSNDKYRCFQSLRLWYVLLFLTLSGVSLHSTAQKDSIQYFTEGIFYKLIRDNHPIAKQADLVQLNARNNLLASRGNFDPEIFTDWDNKRYGSKEYWRIFDAGLKVPTWFGVEVKTGYEQSTGAFLNNERNTPVNGLLYAGISVPLAQNLITDERRTILRQAKIFRNAGDFERISMLNELYMDAAKAYWEWVNAYNEVEIFDEYIRLAQIRFDAVKRSYERGANPAIDTVEALILLQSRQVGYNDAMIELNRTANSLSNFLWTSDEAPLLINNLQQLVPVPMKNLDFRAAITADSLTSAMAALNNHPDLRLKELKVNWLEAERRLKFNKILPKINLNYNFLTEPVGGVSNWNFGGFNNNFKYGINFKMPVFLREEIGNFKMAKVKVQSADYEVNLKRLELQNKLKTYYSDYFYFGAQINTYTNVVANYQKLTDAEIRKFDIGESSIFLINSREQKLIESRLKLIELQSKFNKALAGFYYARGDLYLYR